MSVASVPIRDTPIPFRLLQQYLFLLKKYPILTKSVTSPSVSGSVVYIVGTTSGDPFFRGGPLLTNQRNLLSQLLEANRKNKNGDQAKRLDRAAAARYAIFGLLLTGPLSHYFYQLMEVWMPTTDPYCIVKRLLLDRLVFAPGFLFIFYLVMNTLESKGLAELQKKLEGTYWTALKMNWKVWTPFQFININFVPVQFRVLFANGVALFWYAYLASVRK